VLGVGVMSLNRFLVSVFVCVRSVSSGVSSAISIVGIGEFDVLWTVLGMLIVAIIFASSEVLDIHMKSSRSRWARV